MQHRFPTCARPAFVAASILAATVSLSVLGAAENAGSSSSGKPQTARQRFKNIKVLKDLPADQLIPVMQNINASLGVRCGFCHVGREFERDDKPEKNVARQMVLLTQRLNAHERVVDKRATCYMCHHGHANPETQPPPPPPPGAGAPPAGAGAPPSAPQ